MADLKDSIQKSKEERMKKLEALRKAKQERENARSHNTQFLEPSMREDMNRSYNSDLSLSVSADSGHNSSIIVPKSDYGIKSISKVYLVPKPKTIAYERGIQVEMQTDSEDEEQADTMKGVRTAGFERVTKPDKKEEDENAENAKIKEIDPEEAEKIVASQEFWNFFSKCSNIIEKALDEQFDAAEDFILQQKIEDAFEQKSKLKLLQMLHYKDEERCVSSLEWSPHFDDMIVASYFKSDSIESKLPHGVVNIWHLEDASKPKHTVYCQSSITQAQICPSDPNLLLAGSYGGQLLIWDLRSKSLPIQRSPQFSKGHSFPIVGVAFAESRHSSNVISLSSDGKFCVWVMNYFQNPSETFGIP
jgi:dynein intermediate chain